MGFTNVKFGIAAITEEAQGAQIELLADTGALYSMIPRSFLTALGIQPKVQVDFEIANGEVIRRDVGEARFFSTASTPRPA